jgi:putative endonuclease
MDARHELGRSGEELAARHYSRLGFEVLTRNFRRAGGEIDVVARRGRLVVFCEVKTRRSTRWGLPVEVVEPRKQARIKSVAAAWLRAHKPGRVSLRFDVVSIVVSGNRVELEHFCDAFR